VVAGALFTLGVAIWLLVLALIRAPGGLAYAVLSLVADAVAFTLLGVALNRRAAASSPPPGRRPP
jgi:multidrug transporter EmrE-like cation transporter